MAINPEIHTFIHHLHVRRSLLDQPWMTKLQHLQTIQACHCQRMSETWHHDMPQPSAEPIPHTRPWRPLRECCLIPNWCSWRTRLSSASRPRPGNGDRARLASSSRALPFKSWSLKSREHMTFNSDIWISLIQNFANNAEIDSCLQHLHIWQLSLRWKMTDETTGPPNHPNLSLSKDVENIYENRSIQRWALLSKPDHRNPENKYMQNEKKTFNSFNSNMWISLMRNLANNGNQPRNPHFHSPSTCSKKFPRSTMNDETPAPPNHPSLSLSQDAGKVWESDIMTCRSIQRLCGAHPTHQAFAPSSRMSLTCKLMLATDEFVFSASAKAWKQRQIKAGVFIQGSTVPIVITEIRRTHDI